MKKQFSYTIIALLITLLLLGIFLKSSYLILVLNIVGINTLIVIGINLLIGYAGQISLGHAAFYGIGAYSSAILTATYNVNPWLAMIIAAVITGIVAFLIGRPSLKLKGHYLVMATLGFNIIVSIILVQWEDFTGGPSGIPGIPYLEVGNFAFDSDKKFFFLIWAFVIIALILANNLVNSRVGRALRAIHSSEIAASSLGVNAAEYKVKIFVLSAVFASFAGSLYAHYFTFISPNTFDIMFSIKLIIMSIFGGISTIWGALVGSLTLTVLGEVLTYVKDYSTIALGLILVVTLMFIPEGVIAWSRKFLKTKL